MEVWLSMCSRGDGGTCSVGDFATNGSAAAELLLLLLLLLLPLQVLLCAAAAVASDAESEILRSAV